MIEFNGPWTVHIESPPRGGQVNTLTGGQHYHGDYVAVVDKDGEVICDNGEYYPADIVPDYANLIAAAPELLSALVDALDSLEYVQTTHDGISGYGVREVRIEKTRQVIAKATSRINVEGDK